MKKSANIKTKVLKAIRMINHGATWDEVSEALELSIGYIQAKVKEHYKNPNNYNKLLAKARENKKRKEEEAKILEAESKVDDKKETKNVVVVIETGYLMNKGVKALKSKQDIFIPYFNVKELEKLTNASAVASEVLKEIYGKRAVTCIKLNQDETVFEKPVREMKNRSYGVVAVACYLWASGYHVKLLTNSREIEELAQLQDIGIEVERIEN